MNRIECIDVTDDNLTLLREINLSLFPPYNYFFYISIVDDENALAKLIYYNGKLAGAVTGRLDTTIKKLRRFYILTIGILPPYRRLGLATVLMNHVLNYTNENGKFDSVFLHVQVNNVAAIQFYTKFGFEQMETLDNYYASLEPAAAYILQKNLKKSANKIRRCKLEDGTYAPTNVRKIKRRTNAGSH